MSDAAEAYNRILAYIDARKTRLGANIDREDIHGIGNGKGEPNVLKLSDIQLLMDNVYATVITQARYRRRKEQNETKML